MGIWLAVWLRVGRFRDSFVPLDERVLFWTCRPSPSCLLGFSERLVLEARSGRRGRLRSSLSGRMNRFSAACWKVIRWLHHVSRGTPKLSIGTICGNKVWGRNLNTRTLAPALIIIQCVPLGDILSYNPLLSINHNHRALHHEKTTE